MPNSIPGFPSTFRRKCRFLRFEAGSDEIQLGPPASLPPPHPHSASFILHTSAVLDWGFLTSQFATHPPPHPRPLHPDHHMMVMCPGSPTHPVCLFTFCTRGSTFCLSWCPPPPTLLHPPCRTDLWYLSFPSYESSNPSPLVSVHHEFFRVSSILTSISLFLHGLFNWTLSPALPKASCWREVLALTDITSSPEVHSLSHCSSVPSSKHPCVLDASCPGKLFFHILPLEVDLIHSHLSDA